MRLNITYPEGTPLTLQVALSLGISLGLLALYIWACIWAMNDANRRGKAGCLVGLLVLVTGPLGLLFWLVARPNSPSGPPTPPPVPRG